MANDQPDEKLTKIGAQQKLGDASLPPIPDHELLRCVGSGSFGEVWLARNIMGTYRAVKVIYRKTFSDERPYEREFHGMQKFEPVSRSHDGLIDILQVGRNDPAGYYYYVMELGDDQHSGQRIDPETYTPKTLARAAAKHGRLHFDECVRLGLSLSAALDHLHKHGLIHRDIKPSNIIFVNGIPKIADIGLVAAAGTAKSMVGTEGFMPREGPGIQADIYSLGKVLYKISTGQDRHDFPELPLELEEVGQQEPFFELNEVILKACEADVQQRYQTAEQMHSDLLLLQTGKSVKRLRVLEERWAFVKKVGLIALVMLLIAGAIIYQVNREMKIAAERRQQQVGRNVAYGTRLMDEGDLFRSLPPFVEALSLDQKDPLRQRSHRVRIAAVLQQCPKIVQMRFFDNHLNGAALSPDGRYLLAACVDGTATLCDLEKGIDVPMQIRHADEVEAASFSSDGRYIVTSSDDKSADVWEVGKDKPLLRLAHDTTVYSARFSPDSLRIVTASGDGNAGYVLLWDAATGRRLKEIQQSGDGAFRCAAFSQDGKRVITAGENNTAQVWDLESGKRVGQPIRHERWVYYASFSPDGTLVATASLDGESQVCDAETGRPVLPPLKHHAGVKSVEFSPDGRFLITACWDFTARIWDSFTGEAVNPPLEHSSKHLVYACFSPDGRRVLTANVNGVICLWDLASKSGLPTETHSLFSSDGKRSVAVQGNLVMLKNAGNNSVLSTIKMNVPAETVKLNRDGRRLLTLSSAKVPTGASNIVAQLWDGLTARVLSPPFSLGAMDTTGLSRALLSPDGERLVTFDKTNVQVWDAIAGKSLFSLPHPAVVTGVSFSPDAHWLATRSHRNVHVWDATTGKQLRVLPHQHSVVHTDFSPDGLYLVSCTSDRTLFEREAQVWNVATGNKVGAALKHADGVLHASFSPDGKRVVTTSEDFTARVWETATGRLLLPPLQHRNQVYEGRFSENGRWIVTTCRDKTARVWDADTGEPITPPLKHHLEPAHAQFVNHDGAIVTRTSTGESVVWELPGDEHPIEDLARLAQLLSGHQRDFTGGVLPQTREALSNHWQKLRALYPADFTVSQDEVVAWHQREAEASENADQWRAAVFHWNRLIETSPQDKSFQDRRALAQQRLISGKK